MCLCCSQTPKEGFLASRPTWYTTNIVISDCGSPPAPAYGGVTLDDDITTYGANATQTCTPGYDLIGTAAIWCGVNGSWSDPHVTCSLKGCDTCVCLYYC